MVGRGALACLAAALCSLKYGVLITRYVVNLLSLARRLINYLVPVIDLSRRYRLPLVLGMVGAHSLIVRSCYSTIRHPSSLRLLPFLPAAIEFVRFCFSLTPPVAILTLRFKFLAATL